MLHTYERVQEKRTQNLMNRGDSSSLDERRATSDTCLSLQLEKRILLVHGPRGSTKANRLILGTAYTYKDNQVCGSVCQLALTRVVREARAEFLGLLWFLICPMYM